MARSQKAVAAAAAMLLLSVLLPWVRWSAPWDLRNEASGSVSLADGQWVQFNTFVGEEIVSRTLLHPVYLPLLVGVGVALLGLALFAGGTGGVSPPRRSWGRRCWP